MSDSHDHVKTLLKAMKKAEDLGCEVLVHCGDFCAPFMIQELAKFKGKVHCCYGNTDDRSSSAVIAKENNVDLQGDTGIIEVDNKTIAFCHFPDVAEELAQTGKYDLVCHGHTHTKSEKLIRDVRVINPGEIMGYRSKPSFAIYDTETDDVAFLYVDE